MSILLHGGILVVGGIATLVLFLRRRCLTSAVMGACSLVVFLLGFLAGGPGYNRGLDVFASHVKARVDPEQLQNWATNVLVRYAAGKAQQVPAAELPPFVLGMVAEPPLVLTGRDSADQQYLTLIYGGGFGHWGLRVGNRAYPVPLDQTWEHYERWTDGVYFWHSKK